MVIGNYLINKNMEFSWNFLHYLINKNMGRKFYLDKAELRKEIINYKSTRTSI